MMKMIVAMIQPHKLRNVKNRLQEVGVVKMTVTNVLGCGRQGGLKEYYRGTTQEINLLGKVRLEIVVNDEYVEVTVDAICEAAHSGQIGDGKIFILPVEECIRISTKERGSEAVG